MSNPDPAERLVWASEALHAANAVAAAHRLGLLAALDSGPVRADEAARRLDTDVRRTAVLLEALAATGLVESGQDGEFLAVVPELSVLGALAPDTDLLVQAVRSGRAPLECDVPAGAVRVYPDVVAQRAVSLYAAGLMTRTSGGEVHGRDSYRGWLEEAGFGDIRCHEASRTPPVSVATGSASR